jgi:hypothetical protein
LHWNSAPRAGSDVTWKRNGAAAATLKPDSCTVCAAASSTIAAVTALHARSGLSTVIVAAACSLYGV